MSRKKLKKDDRRFLKRAGFSRQFAGMGGLAVALHEAETVPRPAGYDVVRPDGRHGERTRRRVRRERWNRQVRVMRRMLLVTAVWLCVLAGALLAVGLCWQVVLWLMG